MKWLTYLIFAMTVFIIISQISRNFRVTWSFANSTKFILMWNDPDPETFAVLDGCPFKCQVISNKTELPFQRFDAVVMDVNELLNISSPEAEGYIRSDHQRFVFLAKGPPRRQFPKLKFSNYFNWTMTYRLNSDIPVRSGRVVPKASTPSSETELVQLIERFKPTKNYAGNKTKTAIWTSNCKSNTSVGNYIRELSRFVDVHATCDKVASKPLNKLLQPYKFYLAFEDSVCSDYVTDTFFDILKEDVVPVVYGGADYCVLAPARSYVDARNLTAEQLAFYLKEMAGNDDLYNQFFWWKRHYDVESGATQMASRVYCDLCRKLHHDPPGKVYKDLFWNFQTQCR